MRPPRYFSGLSIYLCFYIAGCLCSLCSPAPDSRCCRCRSAESLQEPVFPHKRLYVSPTSLWEIFWTRRDTLLESGGTDCEANGGWFLSRLAHSTASTLFSHTLSVCLFFKSISGELFVYVSGRVNVEVRRHVRVDRFSPQLFSVHTRACTSISARIFGRWIQR